jgi:hypothetical protein
VRDAHISGKKYFAFHNNRRIKVGWLPVKPKQKMVAAKRNKRTLKQKLSLTISPEMRIRAKQIAKREHRSVSSLVEHLIDGEWRKLKAAGEVLNST